MSSFFSQITMQRDLEFLSIDADVISWDVSEMQNVCLNHPNCFYEMIFKSEEDMLLYKLMGTFKEQVPILKFSIRK